MGGAPDRTNSINAVSPGNSRQHIRTPTPGTASAARTGTESAGTGSRVSATSDSQERLLTVSGGFPRPHPRRLAGGYPP